MMNEQVELIVRIVLEIGKAHWLKHGMPIRPEDAPFVIGDVLGRVSDANQGEALRAGGARSTGSTTEMAGSSIEPSPSMTQTVPCDHINPLFGICPGCGMVIGIPKGAPAINMIDAGTPKQSLGDVRALFDKAIGTQQGCKFTFSFDTERQALRAFEYLADLGSLGTLNDKS